MTTAVRARRAPVQREKVEQAHIVRFLLHLGGLVYVSGTRRRRGRACPTCGTFVPEDQATRQTPGIPDIEAFLPLPPGWSAEALGYARLLLKVEVKVDGNDLSPAQGGYRDQVLLAPPGVHHVAGGLSHVLAWAARLGYIKADAIPHYRQDPAPVPTAGRSRRRPGARATA